MTPKQQVLRRWPKAYCTYSYCDNHYLVWARVRAKDRQHISFVIGTGRSAVAAWRDAIGNND